MKRFLFLGLLVVLSVGFAAAQETTTRTYFGPMQNPKTKRSAAKAAAQATTQAPTQTPAKSRSKGEVYVGYSGTAAPISSGGEFSGSPKKVQHGIETSVTLNASRFVGLKGDFSAGVSNRKEAFAVPGRITTTTRRTDIYNILGGLQFKDNKSEAAVQPFGHVLVGAGIYRQSFRHCLTNNGPSTFCGTLVRDTGLAGALGGGLDFRVGRRTGLRLVSDYNPMRIDGETINNYRFGAGIVFK